MIPAVNILCNDGRFSGGRLQMGRRRFPTRWAILIGLILCTWASSNGRGGNPADRSLADMLTEQDRWTRLKALQSWDGAISEQETLLLEQLANETQHVDWLVNYRVRALLRRVKPGVYGVSPQVQTAEELFAKMNGGKVSDGTYDVYIDEIARLGTDVIPLLLDLLDCRGPDDRYRRDIAIKVLGKLDDPRIVPALKDAIGRAGSRGRPTQELLAVLVHDSSDEAIDYAAGVIARQGTGQENMIWGISTSSLPTRAKMRLYAHYGDFESFGRSAVIRALGRMGGKAAFDQLAGILRSGAYNDEYRLAAATLEKFKEPDATGLFLEVLRNAPDHACASLIIPLASRGCVEAIPILEQRIVTASTRPEGMACRVLAAGALCGLGKDYEKNAAIVREHLRTGGYGSYTAAGWLHDDETIDILISKIASGKPNKEVAKDAVDALGRIGSGRALPALRDALTRVPVDVFTDVGQAIVAIGRKNMAESTVAEGELVVCVARYLRLRPQQRPLARDSPEGKRSRREHEQALAWLRKHPAVVANAMAQTRSQTGFMREFGVRLVRMAEIEMVAGLGKREYRPGATIAAHLEFRNLGPETLYFQREGTVTWEFMPGEPGESIFLPTGERGGRLADRRQILPLAPGETWAKPVQIRPRPEELPPGAYKVKVRYEAMNWYTQPELGKSSEALSGTLVSDEILITVNP
jgi:HEAT repeat protein